MKYCVHYDKNFRHLTTIDEFILNYHGEKSRVPLLDIVQKVTPGQRVLLKMVELEENEEMGDV